MPAEGKWLYRPYIKDLQGHKSCHGPISGPKGSLIKDPVIFEIEIHGMRLWSLLYFDKTQGTLSITLDILKLKFALESKIFNFVRILMVTNHAYYFH